jgi:hypothetical protein
MPRMRFIGRPTKPTEGGGLFLLPLRIAGSVSVPRLPAPIPVSAINASQLKRRRQSCPRFVWHWLRRSSLARTLVHRAFRWRYRRAPKPCSGTLYARSKDLLKAHHKFTVWGTTSGPLARAYAVTLPMHRRPEWRWRFPLPSHNSVAAYIQKPNKNLPGINQIPILSHGNGP